MIARIPLAAFLLILASPLAAFSAPANPKPDRILYMFAHQTTTPTS